MTKEEQNKKACTRLKIAAVALAGVSVLLFVGSFFVPPQGVIDGSILAAAAELFAFAALFMGWESVDRGIDAKITHGNTTIELNNPDGQPNEDGSKAQ